jgi:hypothetical protein
MGSARLSAIVGRLPLALHPTTASSQFADVTRTRCVTVPTRDSPPHEYNTRLPHFHSRETRTRAARGILQTKRQARKSGS